MERPAITGSVSGAMDLPQHGATPLSGVLIVRVNTVIQLKYSSIQSNAVEFNSIHHIAVLLWFIQHQAFRETVT